MSESGSDSQFVTKAELERVLHAYHRTRWMGMGVWCVVFSFLVTGLIWHWKRDNDARREDRSQQIAVIVRAGHTECLRSFGATTAILHASIPEERIQRATADERKVIDHLFALADPKKNCPPDAGLTAEQQKILWQITTSEDK